MRKIINGTSRQVYEIVVDLSCCAGEKTAGETLAKAMEKALKKRDIYDFEITFSNWRTEINLYNRKDCFNTMAVLDVLMSDEDSHINKFEVTVSTY